MAPNLQSREERTLNACLVQDQTIVWPLKPEKLYNDAAANLYTYEKQKALDYEWIELSEDESL